MDKFKELKNKRIQEQNSIFKAFSDNHNNNLIKNYLEKMINKKLVSN
jgi:hypothetical protein